MIGSEWSFMNCSRVICSRRLQQFSFLPSHQIYFQIFLYFSIQVWRWYLKIREWKHVSHPLYIHFAKWDFLLLLSMIHGGTQGWMIYTNFSNFNSIIKDFRNSGERKRGLFKWRSIIQFPTISEDWISQKYNFFTNVFVCFFYRDLRAPSVRVVKVSDCWSVGPCSRTGLRK